MAVPRAKVRRIPQRRRQGVLEQVHMQPVANTVKLFSGEQFRHNRELLRVNANAKTVDWAYVNPALEFAKKAIASAERFQDLPDMRVAEFEAEHEKFPGHARDIKEEIMGHAAELQRIVNLIEERRRIRH